MVNCIFTLILLQVLKESQKLSAKDSKVEEETLDDKDDYDDRPPYERENDAKRYRNKLLLHDVVLVSTLRCLWQPLGMEHVRLLYFSNT